MNLKLTSVQIKGAKAAELQNKEMKDYLTDSITGFEEYYAEPPLRPEEALEEEAMYNPKFSVATYHPIDKRSYVTYIVVPRELFNDIGQRDVSI